jgi:hypothetical protein
MAMIADGWLQDLLAHGSWIFLILGVYWGTTSANQLRIGYKENVKDGFPLSPWITGALVSTYIFGGPSGDVTGDALVYWPIISAIIAALPDFVGEKQGGGVTLKRAPLNKRQNLVILFGTQFLLSCWFQFYFVLQDWIVQYPSLLADDFRKSAFVVQWKSEQPVLSLGRDGLAVKWQSDVPANPPRGAALLDAIEPKLREQLNAKRWSDVEKRLIEGRRDQWLNSIAQQTKQQISPIVEEDNLWRIKMSKPTARSSGGYNFDLQAIWQGPRSAPQRSIVKSCQVSPVKRRASAATKPLNSPQTSSAVTISRFDCKPVKGWGIDAPIVANDTFVR